MDRARDSSGRAVNARPRDRLGRPMTVGEVGIERIPDDFSLPPERTLKYAQELLDDGLAFTAHEVLEAAWKNGPADERSLWQGLAQLAVGITHIQRGNPKGAETVLRRSIRNLTSPDPAPYGIDRNSLLEYLVRLVGQLADPNDTVDLAPRLTTISPTDQR